MKSPLLLHVQDSVDLYDDKADLIIAFAPCDDLHSIY